MMTAKEYLKQFSRMKSFIESKRERLRALKDMAGSTGSSEITGMPRNPSPTQSRMADAVCKAIDLEEEIRRDEQRLQERKIRALDLIGHIDNPDYQSILIHRYFDNDSWEDIAAEMNYSERWLYELHGRGLSELNHILEDCEKEFS